MTIPTWIMHSKGPHRFIFILDVSDPAARRRLAAALVDLVMGDTPFAYSDAQHVLEEVEDALREKIG